MLSSRRRFTATKAQLRADALRAHRRHFQCSNHIPLEVAPLGNMRDAGWASVPAHAAGNHRSPVAELAIPNTKLDPSTLSKLNTDVLTEA